MRQMKVAVSALIFFSCIATAISYYWYRLSLLNIYKHSENAEITTNHNYIQGTPIRNVSLDNIYKDFKRNDEKNDPFNLKETFEEKLVDTSGCKIPVTLVNYVKYIKNNTKKQVICGKRTVYLKKFNDNSVQAFIKDHIVQQFMKHGGIRFDCCYQFVMNAKVYGRNPKPL